MEMNQHVSCVPRTEHLWQRVSDCSPLEQIPEQIVSLVSQCILWVIIFYAYRRCVLFFQGRQRVARQREQLLSYRSQSDTERDAVEQLCSEVQTSSRSAAGSLALPTLVPGKGLAQECDRHLQVPVSICVDPCGADSVAVSSLKDEASRLRAFGQEVEFLQACAGPVVQTRLSVLLEGDTANTLQEIIAKKENRFLVQLGRWRVFLQSAGRNRKKVGTGVEETRMLKLDDTSSAVPVIFHSSYSGGILTVEGLHLQQAIIQAATKDKCITLETKYTAGSDELEVFTSESGLPSNNLGEVFVLASKRIVVDGHELRVNSSAVQIQNDNLRTLLWTIIPFTTLVIYATKQVLSSVMGIMETTNTASVVAWISTVLCMFVVSTQALPQRTETAITASLKKLAVHVYLTLYFAAQCFYLVKDPPVSSSSRYERVSTCKGRSVSKAGESSQPPIKEDIDTSNVNNPEWEWPLFELKHGKLTRYRLSSKHNTGPFEIIFRNVNDMPWASQVQVSISSPFLIEIIKEIMQDTSDRWAKRKKVLLDGPELFRISEKLRKFRDTVVAVREASEAPPIDDSGSERETLLHLNHLLRFVDKEFEDMKPMCEAMKAEGRVSWEMLWAFFPPETRVVYIDPLTEEKLCGEIAGTEYGEIRKHGQKLLVLYVYVSVFDYNGFTWEKCSRKLEVPKFNGECQICSLNIYPLIFEKEHDQVKLKSGFLENGKRFCELSMMKPRCFMNYKGSINRKCKRTGWIVKENADGRVMIDLGSFAKLNPFFPMDNAQPPSEVIRNKVTKTFDITEDETRMFAPSLVYGFSFSRKQWGSFSVSGFSPISFNTSAYNDLVMNEITKDLIENLVRKQLDDGKANMAMQDGDRVDPIASKGGGCVLLCYGPPGTGKTLTAESLSEKLQCPLWCLSVSELGLTPKSLEDSLVQVMAVAASWGAILLLDEADVFLEKRKSSDFERNAMTGVFLRQLEYYRGVLFLTTNRDSVFDDAIRSRIAMFLYYGNHNEDQRRKIWTNVLGRVGLKDIPWEDMEEFAKPEFNGREIRNIVKTAHTLSRSEDDSANLEVDHVRTAFKIYEESSKSWACENPAQEKERDCA